MVGMVVQAVVVDVTKEDIMSKKATTPLEQLTLAALALPLLQNAHAGRVDEWYHSDISRTVERLSLIHI